LPFLDLALALPLVPVFEEEELLVRNRVFGIRNPELWGGYFRWDFRGTSGSRSVTVFPGVGVEESGGGVCRATDGDGSCGGRFGSDSFQISAKSGREGVGGGSVPGQNLGTFRPAVRKKRVGEAKASKVLAGFVKSFPFREWRVCSSHDSTVFSLNGVFSGGSEVPMPLQLNIPFFTISPAIRTGSCFDVNDSVSASEVASVPPR